MVMFESAHELVCQYALSFDLMAGRLRAYRLGSDHPQNPVRKENPPSLSSFGLVIEIYNIQTIWWKTEVCQKESG